MRWQQYAGESRANLVRIAGLAVFYTIHFLRYLDSGVRLPGVGAGWLAGRDEVERRFHLLATFLVLCWAIVAALVQLALRHHVFPRWISAASTASDLALLTCMLGISAGPRSPLVSGYFLIVAMASLRIDLRLVRYAARGLTYRGVSRLHLPGRYAKLVPRLPAVGSGKNHCARPARLVPQTLPPTWPARRLCVQRRVLVRSSRIQSSWQNQRGIRDRAASRAPLRLWAL